MDFWLSRFLISGFLAPMVLGLPEIQKCKTAENPESQKTNKTEKAESRKRGKIKKSEKPESRNSGKINYRSRSPKTCAGGRGAGRGVEAGQWDVLGECLVIKVGVYAPEDAAWIRRENARCAASWRRACWTATS